MTENLMPSPHLSDVQLAIVDKINETYSEFLNLGQRAVTSIVDFTNAGREVGLELQTLRATGLRSSWEQLVFNMREENEPRLAFDLNHGKALIRLVERLPEPAADMRTAASCLKDVLMIQGTIPFPDGHGPQRLTFNDPITLIERECMELCAIWNKHIKGNIAHLSDERREHVRRVLAPIVKMYESLAL